jgi:hypothetical protein
MHPAMTPEQLHDTVRRLKARASAAAQPGPISAASPEAGAAQAVPNVTVAEVSALARDAAREEFKTNLQQLEKKLARLAEAVELLHDVARRLGSDNSGAGIRAELSELRHSLERMEQRLAVGGGAYLEEREGVSPFLVVLLVLATFVIGALAAEWLPLADWIASAARTMVNGVLNVIGLLDNAIAGGS